jgi:hypothetical protein
LLRGDTRLGATWYELIHDRFLEPVRHLTETEEGVRNVLRLSRAIHRARETDPPITGKDCYFSFHEEVCDLAPKDAESMGALTMQELVTVFRCCLEKGNTDFLLSVVGYLGEKLQRWDLVLDHLHSALELGLGPPATLDAARRQDECNTRRAAAQLIGHAPLMAETFHAAPLAGRWAGLMQALEKCAAEDGDPELVAQAVRALGRVDSRPLYDRFVSRFGSEPRFRNPFAQLVEWRLRQENPHELRSALRQLPKTQRWKLRRMVWARRLRQGRSRLAFMGVLAAGMASLFSCLVHWLPAAFRLTFPQTMVLNFALEGLVQSIYFAITGGVTWGVTMTLTLGLCWIVFVPGRAYSARRLRNVSMLSGALGGLLGGLLISVLIILIFGRTELHLAGWDVHPDASPYTGIRNRLEANWSSGIPLVFPSMGLMMGIGIGWIASWLRVSRQHEKNDQSLFGDRHEPSLFFKLVKESRGAAIGLYLLCLSCSVVVIPFVKRDALFNLADAGPRLNGKPKFVWPWRTLVLKFLGESLVLAGGGWAVSVAIATGYLVPKYELPMEAMDE